MAKATSWQEKLKASKGMSCVEPIPPKMTRLWGTGTLCVPAPMEVDEIMRGVPWGRLITVNRIREIVARRHGATIGCPMGTGIFVWIAAHAAEEMAAEGRTDTTPYWRTVKSKGELNDKYPGGVSAQAAHLREEGHIIEPDRAGRPKRVKDWEEKVVNV